VREFGHRMMGWRSLDSYQRWVNGDAAASGR
jgi:hypothetical protein